MLSRQEEDPRNVRREWSINELTRAFGAMIQAYHEQYQSGATKPRAVLKARSGITDMDLWRLQHEGVLPFVLDEAERKLAEGIEFHVVAEDLSLTTDELTRQLLIRQDWFKRRVGHG